MILIPLVGAFLVLHTISHLLYRPPGSTGLILWLVQAAAIGTACSVVLDRLATRLLPLATLCNMSLVFPDQAPSRFGTALRSGSVRKLEQRLEAARTHGLGATEADAITAALELVGALSHHDRLTRGHTERVRAYADIIAVELGLSDEDRGRLAWGVLLHDIGKITVPSEVLNKVEKLTDEEWVLLRGHPAASGELLAPLADWLGEWIGAATEHHERWDGNGYPNGLAGTNISLAGRITAVADAYDVITSKRSYKAPMSVAAARHELVDCAGAQFDPNIVRAFLSVSLARRWAAGPLAALSKLSLGNLSTAPAMVTAGTMVAVGTAAAVAPPVPPLETLAFEAPAVDASEIGSSTTGVPSQSAPLTPSQSTAPTSSIPASVMDLSVPATEIPTTSTLVETTVAPTTVQTTTSSTTTISTTTTTAPTSTASTAGPTSTASTTTASSTTTTAPATTSSSATTSTTTTTTSTTTSTTVVVPPPLYLKNQGVGDTEAQVFKELSTDGPDNPALPNYDTDRDSQPGLLLQPTSNGFGEFDSKRHARWGFEVDDQTVSGTPVLTLFLATDQDLGGAATSVEAGLADCGPALLLCTSLVAPVSADVTTHVGTRFQELTFAYPAISHTFGSSRRLTVRVINGDGEAVHIAFDADTHPSVLNGLLFE